MALKSPSHVLTEKRLWLRQSIHNVYFTFCHLFFFFFITGGADEGSGLDIPKPNSSNLCLDLVSEFPPSMCSDLSTAHGRTPRSVFNARTRLVSLGLGVVLGQWVQNVHPLTQLLGFFFLPTSPPSVWLVFCI